MLIIIGGDEGLLFSILGCKYFFYPFSRFEFRCNIEGNVRFKFGGMGSASLYSCFVPYNEKFKKIEHEILLFFFLLLVGTI